MMGPQCEDGYTKVANELLEALYKIRIPGESMQIFLMILRRTYGYGRKSDRIALSQFQETGIKKSHVQRAISKLEDMKLITVEGSHHNVIYSVNKFHGDWVPVPKKGAVTKGSGVPIIGVAVPNNGVKEEYPIMGSGVPIIGVAVPNNGVKEEYPIMGSGVPIIGVAVPNNGVKSTQYGGIQKKERKFPKESIQKKGKRFPLCEAWHAFKEMRKGMKKPLTDYAEALVVKKLLSFQAKGHDPTDVLNLAIENSWQGIYEPKGKADERKPDRSSAKYDLDDDEVTQELFSHGTG
jgi:phage replication O-like protein O